MRQVIMYGSGINPDETEFSLEQMIPVRVEGFRRRFNQRTAWRGSEDGREGVLNVERSEGDWINAVLIMDIETGEAERLRERESGYRFEQVDADAITPYRSADAAAIEESVPVWIAIGERVDSSLEPIPSYLELCEEGARFWDKRVDGFYEDFLATTENDGVALNHHS
ncbi:MAG: hypothetical protein SVU32_01690 [Candidatus Nanohaloarchaea archaeon]|nr:hypothetical protein [Candidatus Nanohaloarchaea archaeon]